MPLNMKFHLEVIAFPPNFNDIGNTCSIEEAGSDISITVTVRNFLALADMIKHQ